MRSPAPGENDFGSIIVKLRAEHRALEARLDLLNKRLHLSADEQVEKKDLQKLKLKTKDRIFALERKTGRA
ncbi:MAG: DUF465 domain-containing protein [Deltaproteobacteria bacterium]|nr:DUF465 domain-containing protein [Deltaproteobacteria bacterium]